MKKFDSNKIFALFLMIISGFCPMAYFNQSPVEKIKFINYEELKFMWIILIVLAILLNIIDYLVEKNKWWYRIVLIVEIILIYILRSDIKKFVDVIYYNSGGFIPAGLSWGWYLIYISIFLFMFSKNK